jgi:hypothetical protein
VVLYLDSSGLVKRYLAEAGTPAVVAAMSADGLAATSIVAYAELRATFGRALRAGRIDASAHSSLTRLLDQHWPRYVVIQTDDALVRTTGKLVDHHMAHALRGFDALHLASALRLADGDPAAVTFCCWDLRLWRAARDEGFVVLPSAEPG